MNIDLNINSKAIWRPPSLSELTPILNIIGVNLLRLRGLHIISTLLSKQNGVIPDSIYQVDTKKYKATKIKLIKKDKHELFILFQNLMLYQHFSSIGKFELTRK